MVVLVSILVQILSSLSYVILHLCLKISVLVQSDIVYNKNLLLI